MRNILFAFLSVSALIVGAALATKSPEPVAAATEALLFKAGTFGSNDNFCFGGAGWHGPYSHAGDVWPSSGCSGPSSTTVWMDTYGKSTAYSTYYLLGHAYYPGMWGGFQCSSVLVDVFWYNGSSWAWQGSEWYIHTVSTLSSNDANNWPQIWIGYQTWSPSWFQLGYTNDPEVDDPACTGDQYHLHQDYWPDYNAVLDYNHGLSTNTSYYRHTSTTYIHTWSAWNE